MRSAARADQAAGQDRDLWCLAELCQNRAGGCCQLLQVGWKRELEYERVIVILVSQYKSK